MSAKRYATVKIIGLCLLLCTLSGCVRHTEPVTQMGFYLDTVVEITLYDTGGTQSGEEILRECFARIEGYEQLFSASVEGSDIWNINHGSGAAVTVSDETAALLRTALYYSELSGGRTDLTVLPLSELWHFGSEQTPAVPADADIREALSHVDYRAVVLEGSTVTLTDPDAAIDLGFIAKGYIADRLRDYLVEQGVDSACINLGGNLLVIGTKPDGQPYRLGIQKPFAAEGETAAIISLSDASVVTSGVYERCFYENGTLYHHLLDTSTGYPADSQIAGVTVVAPASVDADALSTTCYFLGLDDGMRLIESLPDTEALYLMMDGSMHHSSGFPFI